MKIHQRSISLVKRALGKRMRRLIKAAIGLPSEEVVNSNDFSDIPAPDLVALRSLDPFTMTGIEKRYALLESIRYLHRANIEGAFVECGVWKGGSAMLMASESMRLERVRELFLYDTFEGLPPPSDMDVDVLGVLARERMEATRNNADKSHFWARAQIDEVRANLCSTKYPDAFLRYVKGKVEDTVPAHMPEKIALLRLDTDWYASTKHELIHLYPRLQLGGVLILDDYGYWKGARQAADEYFADRPDAPLLVRVDPSCRLAVKHRI